MFLSSYLRCSLLLAAIGVAGCTTVGPDYKGAPAVAQDALQSENFARAPATGTAAQAPVATLDQPNSPDLSQVAVLQETAGQDSNDPGASASPTPSCAFIGS